MPARHSCYHRPNPAHLIASSNHRQHPSSSRHHALRTASGTTTLVHRHTMPYRVRTARKARTGGGLRSGPSGLYGQHGGGDQGQAILPLDAERRVAIAHGMGSWQCDTAGRLGPLCVCRGPTSVAPVQTTTKYKSRFTKFNVLAGTSSSTNRLHASFYCVNKVQPL